MYYPYPMRRSDRQIPQEEVLSLLARAEWAVLSLIDPYGQPYGVPLSFVFDSVEQALFFHAARGVGRKIESIVSQGQKGIPGHCTLVSDVQVLPDKFSTAYTSVMVSGPVVLLAEREAKIRALHLLTDKYTPASGEKAQVYIQKDVDRVDVIRLQIVDICGKARRSRA